MFTGLLGQTPKNSSNSRSKAKLAQHSMARNDGMTRREAPLLQLKDIVLTFGGTPLLSGAELSVGASDCVSLVGRNGTGKSTLLKVAAALVEPDRGSVFPQPGTVVRYLPQEPDLSGSASTLAYVEAGLRPSDDRHAARRLLEQLGLTGQEDPAKLSGGEARRASLARVLAANPDILLLDEPTNHLDLTTIEWLERDLVSRRAALVIISHDRRLLSTLSRSTVWLDRGQTRRLDRGFAHFEEWRDAVLAEEERDQHKLDRKIVAEEHWMRYGVNGSGKTTLINMLTGVLPPDKGSVRLGSTLAVATLDQHRDSLDPNVTVTEALAEGHGDTVMVNGNAKHVVSYMKDFLFASEQARTPLGKLSGGERGRLMLARVLAKPSNLLVLDEPTNDLDMETLDVLEEMLADYPGTVLLISHDRDFLDRLVSGVIVPEGDGRWTEYAGGYSDMLAQRGADLTRESPKPSQPQKVSRESASVVAGARPTKRRLTFTDKHALETLPKAIAKLQTEIDGLQAKLADPQFY